MSLYKRAFCLKYLSLWCTFNEIQEYIPHIHIIINYARLRLIVFLNHSDAADFSAFLFGRPGFDGN
jgi:hypothetical protein